MKKAVLAIDEGTTGTTVLLVDHAGELIGRAYSEFSQIYPQPGWVEHDAEEIWQTVGRMITAALENSDLQPHNIAAIGITNQRETTVIWERATGRPIHNTIVWQCRRTSEMCADLKSRGLEPLFHSKTGLVIDPYFSGTKIKWLLDNVPNARTRAENGELLFGTIDSWLLWKLSGVHATDHTNASRTLLYNIHRKEWDAELLNLLQIPPALLPKVQTSSEIFGYTSPRSMFKIEIPIAGIAGDQQAALYGQGCWKPGMVKNTYGTGCFVMMNTGARAIDSQHGLLTTLACDELGRPCYALEGSVFIAGAVVQWLRDELKMIKTAAESEQLARAVADNNGVYIVPAFVGLGAPYWDMKARGAIIGLTRGANREHIARAALESIAYQSYDVIEAMAGDADLPIHELRVDGGASANTFLMQFQADMLGIPIDRPHHIESTALGAAYLAGLATGFWESPEELEQIRKTEKIFKPAMEKTTREKNLAGWQTAVKICRRQPD